MATKKFSAFTSAPAFSAADQFVGLVGGDNGRFTRDVVNVYGAGEPIFFVTPSSYFYLDDAGTMELNMLTGGTVTWTISGTPVLYADSSGNWTLQGTGGGAFSIFNQAASIVIDITGICRIESKSGQSSVVSYQTFNGLIWALPFPVDMAAAIDRIAAAVAGILGVPIP